VQEVRRSISLFAVSRHMVNTVHARTTKHHAIGLALTCLIVSGALTPHAVVSMGAAGGPPSRVRSSDPAITALLNEGRERSASFHRLVDAIDKSSGIVYVEFGYCAFGHLNGCMLPFIAPAQGDRYLRVIVTPDKSRATHDQLLALIGHELRHALEVIEHPEVVDLATMDAMYRKIGTPITGSQRGYETSAARAAGAAVLNELLRKTRPAQQARVDVAGAAPAASWVDARRFGRIANGLDR
jgi:hypothetical protein